MRLHLRTKRLGHSHKTIGTTLACKASKIQFCQQAIQQASAVQITQQFYFGPRLTAGAATLRPRAWIRAWRI